MSSKHLSAFPITPCDAAGHVDVRALGRVLAPLVAAGVHSIGLLGTTGSYPYLTREERRRAIEAAADVVGGAVPLLVGVGALRTDDAVALAKDAKAAGAAMGLLAPVSYTPLTDDEVYLHVATVAEESGLPLCLYDNPSTTHFTVTPGLAARVSRLPGVVALKSPAPGVEAIAQSVQSYRAVTPADFTIGYSGDWNATGALLAGADAWYSVAAGLFPQPCMAIAGAAGHDASEARRLNAQLEPLWALFRQFTSLRTMFAAADILGLCTAVPPRPILPLDRDGVAAVARTLRTLDLA